MPGFGLRGACLLFPLMFSFSSHNRLSCLLLLFLCLNLGLVCKMRYSLHVHADDNKFECCKEKGEKNNDLRKTEINGTEEMDGERDKPHNS